MKFVQNPQIALGTIPIADIELDPRSRDDIPAVLKGIQHLYCDDELREQVFALLQEHLLQSGGEAAEAAAQPAPKINPAVGRPGLDLWHVLVLTLLKQGINCDFDRLTELANKHLDVRRMLGLPDHFGEPRFAHRTLARNVELLTPELLAAVNQLVVRAGLRVAGPGNGPNFGKPESKIF